ncbi:MAG: hypothetical protein ABIH39_07455 [Candidatus Margulisiibacteriota bacterium]
MKKINKSLLKKIAYNSSRIEGYPLAVSKEIKKKAKKLISGSR